jgi:predicted CopG family antitoxin
VQIDIDFEVFKELTSLRDSESDSYNAVIRRLLGLPSSPSSSLLDQLAELSSREVTNNDSSFKKGGLFGTLMKSSISSALPGATLSSLLGGVWFGNVHFPDGTRFRANYKGQTYLAEIRNGQWIGGDGKARRSPSDAASAISNTNVNGWRFWQVQMPGDPAWRKLDELKR